MYDGEAEVQSEPGVGSTFTVTLQDAPAGGDQPAAGRAGPLPTGVTSPTPAPPA